MQGDDPPFLTVGTDVSAKYKGAFCEAKIKKVVRNIKCKISLKGGGSLTVNDDVIKGNLRVGSTVEVKQDPKKDAVEAIIAKIQDCSQYTVVFDDGDITTLRRTALCLKSGRHFNESETLDQLPLTHPEHFSTPVISGRRGRRGRAQSTSSSESGSGLSMIRTHEAHVGRVVLVDASVGSERRRNTQPAFPALVLAPTTQIDNKNDYLVRSFKDGRYYTVPKKETRDFTKSNAPVEWAGVSAALQYLNNNVLPPLWDRELLFNELGNDSDDSSDDEPREEKDHFVAQLYKFMDDRGTPLNRNPTIANKDIDLYRLFRMVQKLGGYNRVTNQNQWKPIAGKMGFNPVTTCVTNLCKQAYKKFLYSFEDFYRKLGVTLVAHPRGGRTPPQHSPAGRSLIREKDRLRNDTPPHSQRSKDSDKSEADKSEKEDKPEKERERGKIKSVKGSDNEDSGDNQPLIVAGPSRPLPRERETRDKEKQKEREARDKEKEREKQKEREREREAREKEAREKEKEQKEREAKAKEIKEREIKERDIREKEILNKEKERLLKEKERVEKEKERVEKEKERVEKEKEMKDKLEKEKELSKGKLRAESRPRSLLPVKSDKQEEKRTPKPRRAMSSRGESVLSNSSRSSRRPHASTDSDSSGRASRCGITKKMQSRRSQSANSASSGNTIASSNSSKKARKRKNTETSTNDPPRTISNVKAQVGDKLKVFYGPTQSESKVTYEAKVIEISKEGTLRVHYTGWNTRYDEWIKPQRIAINVTQHERAKKNQGINRRVRPKRTEETSIRSDSDTDTDSEVDVKRTHKKPEDKPSITPTHQKDLKPSESLIKARKRPIRNIATPPLVSPPKKPRQTSVSSHQGRDYDLNEIRSELKGLHTVKQDVDEKPEVTEKEIALKEETNQPEKQAEDVYEFKEPEPFELELHDEKKKRTHRIFDDISPSKYSSALNKSLSEEILEEPIKVEIRSPFRDILRREALEDDSKDGMFSLDDDSLPGDGSSGPIFEGFTPAKNQETYSKKNKVLKLRELIDDSPDSPADDERSSEEENDMDIKQHTTEQTSSPAINSGENSPDSTSQTDTDKKKSESTDDMSMFKDESPKTTTSSEVNMNKDMEDELCVFAIKTNTIPLPSDICLSSIPLPSSEPTAECLVQMDEESVSRPEKDPSSDESDDDKSDSPQPSDVLPPPPAALSDGPKIAEKLLQAISSAKRQSPSNERSPSPVLHKKEHVEIPEPVKPVEPVIVKEPEPEPEIKVEEKSPINPLTIIERRTSLVDLPLPVANKSNKVLSDTIQKLSTQIGQFVPPNIQIPTFVSNNKERRDSTDSDDSDKRLVIDKVPQWASIGSPTEAMHSAALATLAHASKSAGEWSAGESLLMLEDACKNERKHSASVVVAGGRSEDEGISLLCCETIPGSPAPHRPFPTNANTQKGKDQREASWARVVRSPPSTPDTNDEYMSPRPERRLSERGSPSRHKDDDDDANEDSTHDNEKPHGSRSRKASESSAAGVRGRPRRTRRDTDEAHTSTLRYNFYVELDPSWDSVYKINLLTSRLADVRKAYLSVKNELAAIDRRRKKLRRKEREAVKAAKAACS